MRRISKKSIYVVAGARPNFMKIPPLIKEFQIKFPDYIIKTYVAILVIFIGIAGFLNINIGIFLINFYSDKILF